MLPVKQFALLAIAALILITIVSAQTCTTTEVKDALKRSLYEYLTNPAASTLTVAEIKDLLNFYLTIDTQQATVDCSAAGTESGATYESLVTKTETITTTVPACADGTKYGECSATKPKYCYSGSLIDKCSTCGCSADKVCQNERCITPTTTTIPPPNTTTTNTNLTCGTDVCQANEVCNDPLQGCMPGCQTTANCLASGYTGDYFCYLGDVWRRNITYECVTSHGAPYYCDSAITPYVTDDCTGTEYCIEGQAACQLNQSVQLPPDQLTPLLAISNSCYNNCCGDTCSYGASKAIDNSLSTRWVSNRVTPPSTSDPHWLRVDLGQSKAVSTIELTLHGYLAQNYQLQSSSDNANWAVMDSRINTVGTITHTPSATARYWRISVTYSADNGQANVYEFKFFGGTNTTTPSNITCSSSADCGASGPTGVYFCQNGDVKRNNVTYTCLNPGTASASCSSATAAALIDDCASNEICVSGQSACQSNATAPVTCSETDDMNVGKSYYIKGTCSYSNGTSFQDYCQGSIIKEYTCGSYTGPQGSYQSCALWTGGSYTCPEGCSNGACITTLKNCGNGVCDIDETNTNCLADCPLPTTGCTDTDNGQNVYIKGSATGENIGGVVQTDTCTTHYWVDRPYTFGVAEWYCSSATAVAQVPLDCPSGYACDNGACKIMSCTPGTKCIDGNTKGYQDSSCVWSSISDCESPYSCVNGACVSTCFDSDKDIANPSFTKGYCADQTGNYTDYCGSATQARDYYCGGTWTGGQWVNVSCKAGGYSCANGCANGACIP